MPVGLVVPVSGAMVGTWNGFALGTQNDDGYVLNATVQGEEVNRSDAYGMTLVEAIYRGINWRLQFTGLEWNKPGILAAMQAFGSTGAPSTTFTPDLYGVGQRWTANCQALVLTATLGNPPTMPQTLTALSAAIAPQMNMRSMITSKLREAPLEMVLLPYVAVVGSLTADVAFTTT
jgi:hypothetical protein